ncbi:MAG: LD-carboxypeptidase, partial [Candidatus Eremiobacterota bacterium]
EANCQTLRDWGYEPVLRPERRHLYFAGSDTERLEELEWALSAPDIQAVWASRGGYGVLRLLHELGPGLRPRPVVGFSDLTALHVALWHRGWTNLVHGPVLHSLGEHPDEDSRESLRRLLTTGRAPVLEGRTVVRGEVEAPLVGGNLCVLASLCGTPHQLRAGGAILLLEDVHEAPYRLDRYLMQLLQAGVFKGVLAVALGTFVDCNPPTDAPFPAEDVLVEILRELEIPVISRVPVGHGPENLPFRFGGRVRLRDGRLEP